MDWKVAEAKQRFSELLRASAKEPQRIYNRDRQVAAVVEPEILDEFLEWRERHRRPSVGQAFRKLRALCEVEDYTLEVPPRRDRPNAFVESLDDGSL